MQAITQGKACAQARIGFERQCDRTVDDIRLNSERGHRLDQLGDDVKFALLVTCLEQHVVSRYVGRYLWRARVARVGVPAGGAAWQWQVCGAASASKLWQAASSTLAASMSFRERACGKHELAAGKPRAQRCAASHLQLVHALDQRERAVELVLSCARGEGRREGAHVGLEAALLRKGGGG